MSLDDIVNKKVKKKTELEKNKERLDMITSGTEGMQDHIIRALPCPICGIKVSVYPIKIGTKRIKVITHPPQGCILDNLQASLEKWNTRASHMGYTLAEAMDILTSTLKQDKEEGSYYYGWQSNIAMSIIDEIAEQKLTYMHTHNVHNFANKAAKRFLNMLIR
jgi:hypothetical protein